MLNLMIVTRSTVAQLIFPQSTSMLMRRGVREIPQEQQSKPCSLISLAIGFDGLFLTSPS